MLRIHQLVFCRTKVRLLLNLLPAGLHRESRGLREYGLTTHSLRPQGASRPLLDNQAIRTTLQHVSTLALLALLVMALALS